MLRYASGSAAWRIEARRSEASAWVPTCSRAGLLDVHRCALHWESLAAFSEEFPRIRTTPDIFVVDGNRRTCSGGTAALDMMLHLITERESRELANNVPALASASTLAARARAVAEPSRRLRRTRVDDRGDLDAGAVQRQRGIVTTVVIAEHDGAPARAHGELADVALRAPASSVPGRSLFA